MALFFSPPMRYINKPTLHLTSKISHMGFSPSSSPSPSPWSFSWFFVFLLLILLPGTCNCTRILREDNPDVDQLPINPHQITHDHQLGFRLRGRLFNYLPRGVPIPPSGPSKRHNSVVDSVNPNRVDSPWEDMARFFCAFIRSTWWWKSSVIGGDERWRASRGSSTELAGCFFFFFWFVL